MKIVNRTTFLSQPAGTLFSEYEPVSFGQLRIKGVTTPNGIDFYDQQISSAVDAKGSTEFFDILLRAAETGESFPLDFNQEGREGRYDADKQFYAVWERADVERLIAQLQATLTTRKDHEKWISVKDELPKKDGFYWCYLADCPPQSYPQQAIRFTRAHRNVCAGIDDPDRWCTSWSVSHWMELLSPPRKEPRP